MFRRLIRSETDTAGLTLLELVIAILVLSIGSLAALRAADQSRLVVGGMQTRLLAQIVVENRAEELHLLGAQSMGALPSSVPMGGQLFEITSQSSPTASGLTQVTLQARGADGTGAALVVFVQRSVVAQ